MSIEIVIVLEDDLIVRNNLEQCLRRRRYDVASVSTIAAATELLGKDNFDLVFLDMRLPDGDGTDLLKANQQRPQKPLVVVTTGFGSGGAAGGGGGGGAGGGGGGPGADERSGGT